MILTEQKIFRLALATSLSVHAVVFGLGSIPQMNTHGAVELDLTHSGHLGTIGFSHPAPRTPAAPPKPKEKEWVKPSPGQKVPVPQFVKSPVPESPTPPTSSMVQEAGGVGEGDGLTGLSRLPQLLNLANLRAILQRFYPESERAEGREGTVIVDLHVDEDGHVTSAEVVNSAGAAFDGAALRVAKLLRFSPAYKGTQKVPVKLRQAIKFSID